MASHVHQRLSRHPHDRLHARRNDEDWVERQWAADDSLAVVIAGNRIRPVDGRIEWLPTSQAPAGHRILLGEREGRTWFAVRTEPRPDERGEWLPLRGLLPTLAADDTGEAPLLLHALGLAEWLHVTRFCPRCGGPLSPRAEGHELVCSDGHVQFPRTDPAVIMLITDGEPGSPQERCLLGRQRVWPPGRFSTLAGFCEPGESLEDAVRREVAEESGVIVGDVTYFGNQPWPLPASLMLGFFGRAEETGIVVDEDELEEARWLTRDELWAEAETGALVLPGGVSISRSLIEEWYGGPLPGSW